MRVEIPLKERITIEKEWRRVCIEYDKAKNKSSWIDSNVKVCIQCEKVSGLFDKFIQCMDCDQIFCSTKCKKESDHDSNIPINGTGECMKGKILAVVKRMFKSLDSGEDESMESSNITSHIFKVLELSNTSHCILCKKMNRNIDNSRFIIQTRHETTYYFNLLCLKNCCKRFIRSPIQGKESLVLSMFNMETINLIIVLTVRRLNGKDPISILISHEN